MTSPSFFRGLLGARVQPCCWNESPSHDFEIRSQWYERIQPVTNEQTRKILLGVDYFLRLYVGDVPDGAKPGEYELTGIKWPES
jgi:hypothetical protein